MKLLGNNVLVTEVEKEETTVGGIILSSGADLDKGQKPGLVLSVGSSANGQIEPGKRIFLDWSKSMPVTVEGKAAVIVSDEHIKAVF